jgi:glycosyltransferase involved in cell wall biosynthesis
MTAMVDILIPTYRRKTGLAVVLSSLLAQTFNDFNVVISDQTEPDAAYIHSPEIQTLLKALEWRGHTVNLHWHLPRQGLAEQRDYLLGQSRARFVYFVDDDVALEPRVLERLVNVLQSDGCGFVGTPAANPTQLDDVRPHEQSIELWEGPVTPEPFTPDSIPWQRHKINNAANSLHLERLLCMGDEPIRYKVAWIGGASVLYDRQKLEEVGGFSWWRRLPPNHAGEEVVVQFLLIRKYGGCGILPSGTYHLGLPTTVNDRTHNAANLFTELVSMYAR